MSKLGRPYEEVVASVLKEMQPNAKVEQGVWEVGPYGRREIDVRIEGIVAGKKVKAIVECKDFDPNKTGPVGIGYIDSLESKRRELKANLTIICSNAGFTSQAILKAKCNKILTYGVMDSGNPKIRFKIIDVHFFRSLKVESLKLSFKNGKSKIKNKNLFDESVKCNGLPVVNWVRKYISNFICSNLHSNFRLNGSFNFQKPVVFTWSEGSFLVTNFTFGCEVLGGWFSETVEFDCSNGFYDWDEGSFILSPGEQSIMMNEVKFDKSNPIEDSKVLPMLNIINESKGTKILQVLEVFGLGAIDPVPDLESLINPEDLKIRKVGS